MLIDTEKYPIVVSLGYYSLFLAAGSMLRRLVRQHVSKDHQQFFLYLVTAFSVLGCSLENGHIRSRYGRAAYVLVIYLLSLWYSFTIFDSSPNPISNIVNFSRGRFSFKLVLWLTMAQTCGTILAYQSARVFWSFDLCEHHYKRFREEMCSSSLQVPVLTGLFIESVGTMFNVLLNLIVFSRRMVYFEVAVKNLIMCLLTVAVINSTGFYLNPLKASNQSLGCRGTSFADHFLVYWIGPCVSAYLASAIYYRVRKVYREQKAVEEKENAPTPVDDQQQRVSSSGLRQRTSSSQEQQRISSSNEQQRASSYDKQQRTSSSNDQQRASSSDNQQRASSPFVDLPQETFTSYFARHISALLSDQQLLVANQDAEEDSSAMSVEDEPDVLNLGQSRRKEEIRKGKNEKPRKQKKL